MNEESLLYRRRKKTPLYTDKQLSEIPSKARRLYPYNLPQERAVVMDDEKYFTFSNTKSPENAGFWTKNFNSAPNEVEYKGKSKFSKKVLVWVAISSKGISDPFIIRSSSVSINQFNYLKECFQKRLLKFIRDNHPDDSYIFWPDLASSHYVGTVTTAMDEMGIIYVPKINNSPNCPQARPM